ncbi:hypothetical protein EC991_010657 [Linnemannia zychae]|nr:hypothetical protein EC991_010657 [Linnemannia zychae]
MKLGLPIFVAALATSAQAIKLRYEATTFTNVAGTFFKANMFINDISVGESYTEGQSSAWVPVGIHKVQLSEPRMKSFKHCIDVFGDVSCNFITTGVPNCNKNPNTKWPMCTTIWRDDNW